MLEKSRIIAPSKGERNYHVFYHLLAGAPKELSEKLKLKSPEKYFYLNQSQCYTVNAINDIELFEETSKAFEV